MIGLDTNVLVRYIAQDDAKQSARATTLINSLSSENPGFITLVALVELVWVMKSCYNATKEEIVAILETLMRTQELVVENAETAIRALTVFSGSKADFSDCLIERSAQKAGCEYTVTFDGNAVKAAGMRAVDAILQAQPENKYRAAKPRSNKMTQAIKPDELKKRIDDSGIGYKVTITRPPAGQLIWDHNWTIGPVTAAHGPKLVADMADQYREIHKKFDFNVDWS